MSRRPTTAKPTGISRTASSASIAMPPPSKIPARPPSAQSAMTSGDGASRAVSPRKSGKLNGSGQANGSGKGKDVAEGGEINIQVVVRCR
jgi:kinesin family protein 11